MEYPDASIRGRSYIRISSYGEATFECGKATLTSNVIHSCIRKVCFTLPNRPETRPPEIVSASTPLALVRTVNRGETGGQWRA